MTVITTVRMTCDDSGDDSYNRNMDDFKQFNKEPNILEQYKLNTTKNISFNITSMKLTV